MYEAQLSELDRELQQLCASFHKTTSWFSSGRGTNLRQLALQKQQSVIRILTQMLNDKKEQLPYLATLKSIPRDKGLQVAVLDQTAEGLLLAARLANKPFKQALRQLAAELHIPSERLIFGAPKSLVGIARKLESPTIESTTVERKAQLDIFDLNRATIVFEDETELRAILAALPRYFKPEIVVLKNKFQEQWEQASQPPCVHLNLRLRAIPPELRALLSTSSSPASQSGGEEWVVELQLSLRDFLEAKKRCHAIYEIVRLPPNSPLPRACPVCGMLQTFIARSQLSRLEDQALGGQKFVRKARWAGKEVAYSLLAVKEEPCDALRATFLREVGLLTRLEHPNIVQILGVVNEARELGFVTEWVSENTLWDLLKNSSHGVVNSSNAIDVWDVALQLCDALVYVHDHGVVHFDLKSKNVLCANLGSPRFEKSPSQSQRPQSPHNKSHRWRVKLCDFGLSRELSTSLTSLLPVPVGGTPHWQAPETMSLVSSFLPAADVYSFGGVLIELFGQAQETKDSGAAKTSSNGRCWPWMSERLDDVKAKVLNGQKPPELSTIRQPLVRELVEDCLLFEAASRPSMRKVKARLMAAQLDYEEQACISQLNLVVGTHPVRLILTALSEGRMNFIDYIPKCRSECGAEVWAETLDFFTCHSERSPRFEVALAMCRHFVPEASSNGEPQAVIHVRQTSLPSSLLKLEVVSEKHSQEVVGARYLAGWCCSRGHKQVVTRVDNASRAVMHYSQASFEGYALAQYELAMCYRHGRGVAVDLEEATRLFAQAANKGHVGSQLSLARCYGVGEGVPTVDSQACLQWLIRATQQDMGMNHDGSNNNKHVEKQEAKGGDGDAHGDAAIMMSRKEESRAYLRAAAYFEQGVEVEQDMQEAHRLYKLYIASVSSQSYTPDSEEQCNLGDCYYCGRGVEKDVVEAARLYRLSVDGGNAAGQRMLGVCYGNGLGVEKDLSEAVRLFQLAVNQGNARALNSLGMCYQHGTGVDKDLNEAMRLYRLSVNQGHSGAQCTLGLCYQHGTGVDKDLSESVRLYRLSANQGNSQAQFNLAVCYRNGTGVDKDLNEAMRLYRLSANQGHSQAQFNMGVCCQDGVYKDLKEAVRLYRLSADQGHSGAQCNLGACYQDGMGVDKDLSEAVRLYRLSAGQGHSGAQCNLGLCYQNGTGVDKDLTEAVRLYHLSASQGNSDGQCNLGLCYWHGMGVAKDLTEAMRLYRLAADQGHPQAQHNLVRGNIALSSTEV